MSTTEFAPSKSRTPTPANGANGVEPNWSDQVLLSSAGLLSGGIERTRLNAEGVLDVADAVVLGSFDLFDEWSSLTAQVIPQIYPMLTTKPAQLARHAYTATSRAIRDGIGRA